MVLLVHTELRGREAVGAASFTVSPLTKLELCEKSERVGRHKAQATTIDSPILMLQVNL